MNISPHRCCRVRRRLWGGRTWIAGAPARGAHLCDREAIGGRHRLGGGEQLISEKSKAGLFGHRALCCGLDVRGVRGIDDTEERDRFDGGQLALLAEQQRLVHKLDPDGRRGLVVKVRQRGDAREELDARGVVLRVPHLDHLRRRQLQREGDGLAGGCRHGSGNSKKTGRCRVARCPVYRRILARGNRGP